MNILTILIAGVVIFIIFFLFRIVIRQYTEKHDGQKYLSYLNLFELIIWTVFYFWAIDRSFHGKSYYAILINSSVVLLVILATWYYFKDLVAGIIFKLQHNPVIGKRYTFDKNTGVIKKLRSAHLILETSDGDEVQIPYSQIQGLIQESSSIKSKSDSKIKITTSKDSPKEAIISQLKEQILYSPWTTYKKEPVVKFLSENDDSYEFEISLSTLNNKHLSLIEKQLKQLS